MSKIFFSSDLHFSHKNIIDYCSRPFKSVEEMNYIMTEKWNKTVSENDIIYYLGDFALGKTIEIPDLVNQLNGEIHLIYGNHDEKVLSKHRQAKWSSIQSELYVEIDGYMCWMNHYPIYLKPDKYDRPKLVRPKAKRNYDIALAGHSHEKFFLSDGGSIAVCGDLYDFYPQTLEQLIQKSGWSKK